MALIGRIRANTGLLVGVVTISLILFLVGSDLIGLGMRTSTKDFIIGKVRGEKITLRAFQERLATLQHNFALQYDRMPDESEKDFLKDQAWQEFITSTCYAQVSNALGITVSEDELVDMVQGEHIHPHLKAVFTNPETKEFDQRQLLLYLEKIAQMPMPEQAQWHHIEQSLAKTRCNTKFNELIRHSVFMTDVETEAKYQLAHTYLDIRYLYVPYDNLPDESMNMTDTMLKDYLKAHKNDYQIEECRGIRYVTFPITPTEEDRIVLQEELQTLKQAFLQAKNDSVFASIHTDGNPALSHLSLTQAQLDQAITYPKDSLKQGMVIGPIASRRTYKLYKISDLNAQAAKPYQLAVIEKILTPGDGARDKSFRLADGFASTVTNQKQFDAQAVQDTLQTYEAEIGKNDTRVGILSHAREMVRWLYNDARIGKVSPVFELPDNYIVAVMTEQVKAGTASLDRVREKVRRQVINKSKAQWVINQLRNIPDTTLAVIANKLSHGAQVLVTEHLKFSDNTLKRVGLASKAIGQAFALKKGEKSLPITGDHGVLLIEVIERHEVQTPNKLTDDKYDQQQLEQFKQVYYIPKSLEKFADIKDYRYRFY